MKKLLYMLMAGMVLVTMSCRDEDLNPHPKLKTGAFVQIEEVLTPVFDSDNLDVPYSFRVVDQFNTVASYRLSARWVRSGVMQDTVFIKEITSFPATVNVTLNEIADAYAVDVNEIKAGDRIMFIGTSTGTDGTTTTTANIQRELLGNPGQRQAYRFSGFVICPFVASEIGGTYVVTNDDFGFERTDGAEYEVVAGPAENQLTIKNIYGQGFDLVLDVVNTAESALTSERQRTWTPTNYTWGNPAWGAGYTQAQNGYAFSCVGIITFNAAVSVDAGSFGTGFNYTLQRID